MRGDKIQIILITSGVLVTGLFGMFLYREFYSEYRLYQNDYLDLEVFRSSYTHEDLPPFKEGIKQIVLEREDKGPAIVDRCTSCHVALQIPYFSPTKIAHDLNGNIIRDATGSPLQVPNEDYIWGKLDEKINELNDPQIIRQLKSEGKESDAQLRLTQAKKYEDLKIVRVGDHLYDVKKVLAMHPLMGHETRPFEFHPIEEYGCTSCHSGNGRGLTTDKAHGPVFDGQYEKEERGFELYFTESDPDNDPKFSREFNAKPGHELLFQTTPIFTGALIQAKCVQCHETTGLKLAETVSTTSKMTERSEKAIKNLWEAYNQEVRALKDLLKIDLMIKKQGLTTTLKEIETERQNYSLPGVELSLLSSQQDYIKKAMGGKEENQAQTAVLKQINDDLVRLLGSESLVNELKSAYSTKGDEAIVPFLKQMQNQPKAKGILFEKAERLDFNQELLLLAGMAQKSFQDAISNPKVISALNSDVDLLTRNYQKGRELYLSQACYACHRISGFTRGGVGPELTKIGDHYPWYIKESIVWPQADLATSTMPNMRLDHDELENLMTFLLAQKGGNRAIAETEYQSSLQSWEAGRKQPWEKPIPPAQMYDLNYAMTVFATQGCASCHRLKGFDSNVVFNQAPTSEKGKAYKDEIWFKKLFPEVINISSYDEVLPGSLIVDAIEKNASEIDKQLVFDTSKNGLLDEIAKNYPDLIEAMYSNFRFASRAKNAFFENQIKDSKNPQEATLIQEQHNAWKDRVHRVLMMYIQVYGFGRLIGPHLNWSGIYRSDEWLMEHFKNPSSHVPRSIMPTMPFDDTKFYALTHMLDQLGIRNRNAVRQNWDTIGFNPQEAYELHCAQCHGISLKGNGVIAEWIYPIPKNLRNPDFLRNLSKEQAIRSIKHGVKGTPMPPWGETSPDKSDSMIKEVTLGPVLNEEEIDILVDWLFHSLPGGEIIKENQTIPKWHYTPEDVLKELQREGGVLKKKSAAHNQGAKQTIDSETLALFPNGNKLYASLSPTMQQADIKVSDVFDNVPDKLVAEKDLYYIKKEYYTPENIEAGKEFFLMNCAVCHGAEADGSGIRGQAMHDAKPRMLNNLDWIDSRDDLRLLRSIKYGVQGTSMTPWGDFTSSLQRMQLVMFIRTLSQEKDEREQLNQAIYQTFDQAQLVIGKSRIETSQKTEQLKKNQQSLEVTLGELEREIAQGKKSPNLASQIYQLSLTNNRSLERLNEQDRSLTDIHDLLKKERDIYQNLGYALIMKGLGNPVLEKYTALVRLNENRYQIKNEKLIYTQIDDVNEMRKLRKPIETLIQKKIMSLKHEREFMEARLNSYARTKDLEDNEVSIKTLEEMSSKLITDTEDAWRLAGKQKEKLQNISPGDLKK